METFFTTILTIGAAAAALAVLVPPVLIFSTGLLACVRDPGIPGAIFADLKAIRERDPAAESWIACMFYPGWWALGLHRLCAHPLYQLGLRTPARLCNFLARFLTGTDIHPGATFGRGIFIDHAHGVVIGETAVVHNNVTMLHQVTLGGTGKDCGKRHPTIEEGVLLGVGSKVLGNIIIGSNSKIGAGSVVIHSVPPQSTVVGVPGKVVASGGKRIPSQNLEQTNLPDPLVETVMELREEVRRMKEHSRRLLEGKGAIIVRQSGEQADVLKEIVEDKRDEVETQRADVPLFKLREVSTKRVNPRSFYNALKKPGVSLIAEIKKASPSGGLLRPDFDPAAIAEIYERSGASALSVLTNVKYFQGHPDYINQAREACSLPILRKEFIISEYQIVEAERLGADAILLIAACLDEAELRGFREAAEGEGLDVLVEVHDEAEMETALKTGARILGINNRNLKTLKTSLETTFTLAAKLSKTERERVLLVSESGISKPEDIIRLKEAGVNAVLIGEAFMRSPDIAQKVREVMGAEVSPTSAQHYSI